MTQSELQALLKGLVPAIKTHIDQSLAALETRVASLESKPHVKFCGVWNEQRSYAPGEACTRSGGLWICTAPTHGAFDHASWQLAVKRGEAR